MPLRSARPCTCIALVVSDDSAEACAEVRYAIATAAKLGIAVHLFGARRWLHTDPVYAQASAAIHCLPHATMDGSLAAKRYLSSVLTGVTRVRPDVVLGVGEAAGVACSVSWQAAGATQGIWYQRSIQPGSVHPRAMRLAVAWVSCVRPLHAATDAMIRMGAPEGTLQVATDLEEVLRIAAETGIPRTNEVGRRAAAFDRRMIVRSIFPQVVDREEHAAALAHFLRESGVRAVSIKGTGPNAQILSTACRTHRIRIARGRARVIALASSTGARATADWLYRQARDQRQTVHVVAVGFPGFAVHPRGRAEAAAENRRRAAQSREIERRIRPMVKRIQRDEVRNCSIYGASDVGRVLLTCLRRQGVRVVCFVDSDDQKWGERLEHVPVMSLAGAVAAGQRVYAIGSLASAEAIARTVQDAYRSAPPPVLYSAI